MTRPKLICLIGAESTGKTSLAQHLAARTHSPWVREYLRTFCDAHQRTPFATEQALILETQHIHERAALVCATQQRAPYVFCDGSPLLTAIYSEFIFSDTSLYPRAHALHARYDQTLFLQPDIGWQHDGLQRDGAQVQVPITMMIERALSKHANTTTRIFGAGEARFVAALRALGDTEIAETAPNAEAYAPNAPVGHRSARRLR